MIVHLLPGDTDSGRQRGGRGGHGQLSEQTAAQGLERDGRGGWIGDDFDVEHLRTLPLTILFVNKQKPIFLGPSHSVVCTTEQAGGVARCFCGLA